MQLRARHPGHNRRSTKRRRRPWRRTATSKARRHAAECSATRERADQRHRRKVLDRVVPQILRHRGNDRGGLKDFDFLFWGAIYAPAGTPDEIVQKLSTTIGEIMRDEKVGKRLRDVGNEPIGSSPVELDKYWKSEIDLYRKIVTDAGIKLEQ